MRLLAPVGAARANALDGLLTFRSDGFARKRQGSLLRRTGQPTEGGRRDPAHCCDRSSRSTSFRSQHRQAAPGVVYSYDKILDMTRDFVQRCLANRRDTADRLVRACRRVPSQPTSAPAPPATAGRRRRTTRRAFERPGSQDCSLSTRSVGSRNAGHDSRRDIWRASPRRRAARVRGLSPWRRDTRRQGRRSLSGRRPRPGPLGLLLLRLRTGARFLSFLPYVSIRSLGLHRFGVAATVEGWVETCVGGKTRPPRVDVAPATSTSSASMSSTGGTCVGALPAR